MTDVIEIALFFHKEEMDYKGYKRAVVPVTAVHWKQEDNGDFTNRETIFFPETSDFIPGRHATHFAVFRGGVQVVRDELSASLSLDMEGISPQFPPRGLHLDQVILLGHKRYLNAKFADLRLVDESDRAFLACGTHLIYGPLNSAQQHAFITLSKLVPLS